MAITYHVMFEPATPYEAPEDREAAIENAAKVYGLTDEQRDTLRMYGQVLTTMGRLQLHAGTGFEKHRWLAPTQLPVGYVLRKDR